MKQAITIRDAGPQDAEMIAGVIRPLFQDVAVRFSLMRDNCPKHPSNCTTAWVESDLERGVHYLLSEEIKNLKSDSVNF